MVRVTSRRYAKPADPPVSTAASRRKYRRSSSSITCVSVATSRSTVPSLAVSQPSRSHSASRRSLASRPTRADLATRMSATRFASTRRFPPQHGSSTPPRYVKALQKSLPHRELTPSDFKGIVLRMLEGSESLSDVTHIIIDEVHERSIDSDFLLIVLREILKVRKDLKCVLSHCILLLTAVAKLRSAESSSCPRRSSASRLSISSNNAADGFLPQCRENCRLHGRLSRRSRARTDLPRHGVLPRRRRRAHEVSPRPEHRLALRRTQQARWVLIDSRS